MGEVGCPARSREADGKDSGKIVSADHGRSQMPTEAIFTMFWKERASLEVFRRGRSGSGSVCCSAPASSSSSSSTSSSSSSSSSS